MVILCIYLILKDVGVGYNCLETLVEKSFIYWGGIYEECLLLRQLVLNNFIQALCALLLLSLVVKHWIKFFTWFLKYKLNKQ